MKHNLFDVIQQIRTLASNLFDKAEAMGARPEDMQKQLEPLRQMLESCIQSSKPGELMRAIKDLEHLEGSHIESIKFYQEKLKDTQNHTEKLREALISQIKAAGRDYLLDGDFRANLVTAGPSERVVIR